MGSHEPPPASTDPLSAARQRRRRLARFIILGGLAVVVVVLALAIIDALRIRADVDSGQDALSSLDFVTIDRAGGIVPITDHAANRLHRARTRAADSPWLGVLSHLPLIGDQVAGMRDLTHTADEVGALARSAGSHVQDALDRASKAGPEGRIVLIDEMATTADNLQTSLRRIQVSTSRDLAPPLSGARDDLVRRLHDADTQLDDGKTTLQTLRALLVGPRRYLILGGNNSEMRSVGIATTSGLAGIANGQVKVGQFFSTDLTQIDKPGVPLPDGWDWLYGYLDPAIAFSNVVTSPNFDRTGEVASQIAAHDRFGPVDGVIYVDTIALQTLLGVVGPVTVDGTTYDQNNAARILINENYLKFSLEERPERRDAQGRVAQAIFDTLNSREVSLVKLAATLQTLATQRHIAAWSSRADEEKLFHVVGADGVRNNNDLLIAAEELGTSKLDFYVTEKIDMKVDQEPNGRRVHLSISITNPPRTETSPYIEGGSRYAEPGQYGVYLIGFLPLATSDIDHPDPSWTSWAIDGPLQATTFTTRVDVGTTKTLELSFSLPRDVTKVNVIPSARVKPILWNFDGRNFLDYIPHELDITGDHNVGSAGWLVSGLLLLAVGMVLVGNSKVVLTAPTARVDLTLGRVLTTGGVLMIAAQFVIYRARLSRVRPQ